MPAIERQQSHDRNQLREKIGRPIKTVKLLCSFALAASFVSALGQTPLSPRTPVAASAPTPIPALVAYSGIALTSDGKPRSGEAAVTFLIFREESGGEPLWVETQTATVDGTGHYKVQLGAENPNGLPADLFSNGEARWLEVQLAGEATQPRVLLASVPYALKAADAATLGGLPASAFALAGTGNVAYAASAGATAISPESVTSVTTAGGASGYLPVFNSATSIVDSVLFQSAGGIGIGDTPAAGEVLDVNGKSIFRNSPTINRNGNATTSVGVNSFPLVFEAETYNSSSKAYTYPEFSLQAEAVGNDSSTPTSALHFLFNSNLGYGAETGLYFNANGTIHFASAQTFDGVATSGVGITGASTSSIGVQGTSSTSYGMVGTTTGNEEHTAGVYGVAGKGNTSTGITEVAGVWGDSSTSIGVVGSSDQTDGVYGVSAQGDGVMGQTLNLGYYYTGVYGTASGDAVGVYGDTDSGLGVYGYAGNGTGVEGYSYGGSGVYGIQGYSYSGYAGEFEGNVSITGTLTAGTKDFKIDHPSDPANKYLVHASIESSEMVNIYSGNVTTDELGLATIQLPDWFEAENGDFRYQLTVLGQFAQAIVKTKIANHQFTIMTNASRVEVSWQVTGVRQDAYAKAHPLVVEEAKPVAERGYYMHPELYGQPKEKQTAYVRHPAEMLREQAARNAKKPSQATLSPGASAAGVSH